jgi:lysophospholipase L1-like esterase
MIVGDSIAVGVSKERPECVSYAKGGINSHQWINKYIGKTPLQARHVIISLGSNDHKYIKTEDELRTLRQLTNAQRVYWIMPSDKFPEAQSAVWHVANENNDVILPMTRLQKDNIHPSWAGYKQLADKTR